MKTEISTLYFDYTYEQKLEDICKIKIVFIWGIWDFVCFKIYVNIYKYYFNF